jgi:hypothetical protein
MYIFDINIGIFYYICSMEIDKYMESNLITEAKNIINKSIENIDIEPAISAGTISKTLINVTDKMGSDFTNKLIDELNLENYGFLKS